MKKLTKEQFFHLLEEAKSDDPIKVSDLIEMLKPFEDYYLYDPRCHYCAGLYLTSHPAKENRLKSKSNAISIIHGHDIDSLEEYLQYLRQSSGAAYD